MHLIELPNIVMLLKDETDIVIDKVKGSHCFLTHAPIDVVAEQIYFTISGDIYMETIDIINVLSVNVFGQYISPLFDAAGNWTHVALSE